MKVYVCTGILLGVSIALFISFYSLRRLIESDRDTKVDWQILKASMFMSVVILLIAVIYRVI